MAFLWKGLLIGILFGIPVGTVGTMTIQRTLTYGAKIGIITGLGSSVADCLYALVGALGLTFISDFLLKYTPVINFLGGGFLLLMGMSMLMKKEIQTMTQVEISALRTFFPSFLIGITNPVAVLTFLFAFTYFKIPSQMNLGEGFSLVLGIFLGTLFWWIALVVGVEFIKNKRVLKNFSHRNKVFGVLYIVFAAVVLIKTVTSLK